MKVKKTLQELLPGTVVLNGYIRIPKVSIGLTPGAHTEKQVLLAIIENLQSENSTVEITYLDTVITNEEINGNKYPAKYNRYLVETTALGRAKVINPPDY